MLNIGTAKVRNCQGITRRELFYKVGSPPDNIPFATVSLLEPCDKTYSAGARVVARAEFRVSVHDNPSGHEFLFGWKLRLIDPSGKESISGGASPDTRFKGGSSEPFAVVIAVDAPKTNQTGQWRTEIQIDATDADKLMAKPVVILHKFCAFQIAKGESSSSSSSSSSSTPATNASSSSTSHS
jgi:hypothetical protein